MSSFFNIMVMFMGKNDIGKNQGMEQFPFLRQTERLTQAQMLKQTMIRGAGGALVVPMCLDMWVSIYLYQWIPANSVKSYVFSVLNYIKCYPFLEVENNLTHSYALEDFNVVE